MIINFEETFDEVLKLYKKFADDWKKIEVYPEPDKLGKQFKYADRKGIKYCIILWKLELEKKIITIKNLQTGESVEETLDI
jgi:histidyl-tRNA synthetase